MASRAERKAFQRVPYTVHRADFIAAWNDGGEAKAAALLEEKKQRCPPLGEVFLKAFGEVKGYATKVHATA
jgi:hypothetical protein